MFVIIVLSIGYKPFPLFVTNTKKIVNFFLGSEVLDYLLPNRKAHDYSRAIPLFIRWLLKLSRFRSYLKSENALYVNML